MEIEQVKIHTRNSAHYANKIASSMSSRRTSDEVSVKQWAELSHLVSSLDEWDEPVSEVHISYEKITKTLNVDIR
jgi:hypothetical protein